MHQPGGFHIWAHAPNTNGVMNFIAAAVWLEPIRIGFAMQRNQYSEQAIQVGLLEFLGLLLHPVVVAIGALSWSYCHSCCYYAC